MIKNLFAVSLVVAIALALASSITISAPTNDVTDIDEDLTNLALFETDAIETAGMTGFRAQYKDYCIRTRDYVKNYLNELTISGTKSAFNIMLYTSDPDDINETSADKAVVTDAEYKQNAKLVQETIEEGKKALANKASVELAGVLDRSGSLVKNTEANSFKMWSAVKNALRVVLVTAFKFAHSETAKRLEALKSKFTVAQMKEFVEDACHQVSFELKNKLDADFKQTRIQVVKAAKDNAEELADLTFETVGCVTTRRITTFVKYCSFLAVAGPVIWPLFEES